VLAPVLLFASLLLNGPLQELFQKPPDDSRILMRWWWFGPSVTTAEVEAEMRRMKEGGIGGFELAVVYPMALDDPARGLRNEGYLSPGFLEKVAFTSRKARELGLRMDVTIGSGWSYGGPYITPALAAARLRSDRREVTPDVTSVARPMPFEGDRLIAAFVGRGSLAEVDPTTFRELDVAGGGPIPLPPGEGPRLVLLYFSGQTGQVVKRAAIGAEGYVLDHFQREAIETHLREAGDKLLAAAGPGGVHAAFCDSLEVYGADWTADLPAEFRKRRGYDLRGVLPLLEYDVGERSGIKLRKVIPRISWLLVKGFFWRMREKYVIRDFHPLVFFYALGFLMTLLGLGLGIAEVVLRIMGNAVSVGTVVLVALLLIFGSQFTLFAMWFDMESNKELR